MPGGYGTSGPWGSAGTTSPRGSYSAPGGGNVREGSNRVADLVNVFQQNPTLQSQQAAQTAIAEQTPIDPWRNEDLTSAEEWAGIASIDPKYGRSWEGQQGHAPKTLGKFIATDSLGNPILDSSGNVIWTGLGREMTEHRDGNMNLENLQEIEREYYAKREAEQAQQGGYDSSSTVSGGYGYNTPLEEWSYGEPYSEARYAPLEWHKRMVDVNSPLYAARGGIMSLRR